MGGGLACLPCSQSLAEFHPLQAMVLQANAIGVTEISKACLKAMSPSSLVEHQSI